MFAWQFARALQVSDRGGLARFVSMQNHYNLVYREEEREMMPLCVSEGIGVIPWSPIARGFLTGNRKPGDNPKKAGGASSNAETARAGCDEFAHMRETGALAEWAEVHGNWYGTLRSQIDLVLSQGKHVLMDIDVQGARQFRAAYPESVLVFLIPPSAEALLQRLSARQTESGEAFRTRVQAAREEVVDRLSVHSTNARRCYLEALLAFADEPAVYPAAPFIRRRQLFHRMMLISKEGVMSPKRIVASGLAMAGALALTGWYGVLAFPLTASTSGSPGVQGQVQAQPRDPRPDVARSRLTAGNPASSYLPEPRYQCGADATGGLVHGQ